MCCIILRVFMQDWLWTLFCLFCPLEICESVGACWREGNFLSCFSISRVIFASFILFYLLFLLTSWIASVSCRRLISQACHETDRCLGSVTLLVFWVKVWSAGGLSVCERYMTVSGLARGQRSRNVQVCVCLDACVCDWDRDHAQQGWQSHWVLVLVHS